MRNNQKMRIISCVLILCMLFSLVPTAAFAADAADEKSLTVSGTIETYQGADLVSVTVYTAASTYPVSAGSYSSKPLGWNGQTWKLSVDSITNNGTTHTFTATTTNYAQKTGDFYHHNVNNIKNKINIAIVAVDANGVQYAYPSRLDWSKNGYWYNGTSGYTTITSSTGQWNVNVNATDFKQSDTAKADANIAANKFIAAHLTASGSIITEATEATYAKISGGATDWNALSADAQNIVNQKLSAAGGTKTYPALLNAALLATEKQDITIKDGVATFVDIPKHNDTVRYDINFYAAPTGSNEPANGSHPEFDNFKSVTAAKANWNDNNTSAGVTKLNPATANGTNAASTVFKAEIDLSQLKFTPSVLGGLDGETDCELWVRVLPCYRGAGHTDDITWYKIGEFDSWNTAAGISKDGAAIKDGVVTFTDTHGDNGCNRYDIFFYAGNNAGTAPVTGSYENHDQTSFGNGQGQTVAAHKLIGVKANWNDGNTSVGVAKDDIVNNGGSKTYSANLTLKDFNKDTGLGVGDLSKLNSTNPHLWMLLCSCADKAGSTADNTWYYLGNFNSWSEAANITFVADYLTDGTIITAVTGGNYQQVLDAKAAWNALSPTAQLAVNAELTKANGGKTLTYDELLKAAETMRDTVEPFIKDYLTDGSGNMIIAATLGNCATIAGGEGAWEALSDEAKKAVNAALKAAGCNKDYAALLDDAKVLKDFTATGLVKVTTASQLEFNFDGQPVRFQLDGDIILSDTFKVDSDENVILDLNGHTISTTSSGLEYAISNAGTLKIIDGDNDSDSTGGAIVNDSTNGIGIVNTGVLEVAGDSNKDITISGTIYGILNKNDEDDPATSLTVYGAAVQGGSAIYDEAKDSANTISNAILVAEGGYGLTGNENSGKYHIAVGVELENNVDQWINNGENVVSNWNNIQVSPNGDHKAKINVAATHADKFIAEYLTDGNNNLIIAVTDDNYGKIAGGKSAWAALSAADKAVVNAKLTEANGGVALTYDELLEVAEAKATANAKQDADDFMSKYLTLNGSIVTTVDVSTYDKIKNGANAWMNLSDAAKALVNAALKAANGGEDLTYEALLEEANNFTVPSSGGSGGFSGVYNYPVSTPQTNNGSASLSDSSAAAGETVTITTAPDKGYGVSEVVVTDKNGKVIDVKALGNGQYTFVMPAGGVDVQVVTKPAITLWIDETKANVFGRTVENDVAPMIKANRTMLPIRFVAEALGAEVGWNAQQQKVTITNDDTVIELYIGKTVAYVNGEAVQLDTAPFIKDARTYLPVRFVSEYLGAVVNWYADTKAVTIVPAE